MHEKGQHRIRYKLRRTLKFAFFLFKSWLLVAEFQPFFSPNPEGKTSKKKTKKRRYPGEKKKKKRESTKHANIDWADHFRAYTTLILGWGSRESVIRFVLYPFLGSSYGYIQKRHKTGVAETPTPLLHCAPHLAVRAAISGLVNRGDRESVLRIYHLGLLPTISSSVKTKMAFAEGF